MRIRSPTPSVDRSSSRERISRVREKESPINGEPTTFGLHY